VLGARSSVELLPVDSDLGSKDDCSLSIEKRAGLQQHSTCFTELLYASPSQQKKGRMDKIVLIEMQGYLCSLPKYLNSML
jgi:hypothetical protein